MVDFRKLLEQDEDAALKNYVAQLPVYGIDPETGFTNYTNPVIPQLRLPVQGIHDQPYIPTQADLRGSIQFMPSVQQGIANVKDIYQHGFDTPENLSAKVFGPMEGGASDVSERTQAWPEKIVRSGTTLANDVMAGKVLSGPGLRAGDYSDIPGAPEPLANLIERTQDMAGLAAGGSIAATGLKAEKPGLLARGASNLKDRLHQFLAEDDVVGTGVGAAKNSEVLIAKRNGNPQVVDNTEVLKNPTENEFRRFVRSEKEVRTFVDSEGNLYAWQARNATHDGIAQSLNLPISEQKPWSKLGDEWSIDKNKIFNKSGKIKEGYPAWMAKMAEDDIAGTSITGIKNSFTGKPLKNVANGNAAIPGPVPFPERLYTNYARAIEPEDVLKSEPVWSGADRLSSETGIPYNEAFAQIANEFWRRQGANRFITPELAEKYIKRERSGFKLAEDDIAGTAVTSLADRLHEHLNERPNVSNEYKGESMPEILARQRASEGYEAAIRDPETKKLYTGMWHEEVLDKIAKDRGVPKAYLPDNLIKGYINDRGRFLTEEAVEKLSQNKSKSKTAIFRSDDEAGTAIAAAKQSGNYIRMVPEDYNPHATDWYHGSSSIDKVVKGINPAKAESGPQIYFTDNPEIGSKYATDKKNYTSRASDVLNKYELEAYRKWFSNHGENKTDFERKEIAPILQKVKENHYNREGVLPAKLNIRNPLMTDQKEIIINQIIPKLEKAFKNDKIGEEWINKLKNDLNNNINSSAWTYIPKQVTEELKKFGFDGIIDKGGKANYDEIPHNVAIPFYPQQVRSKFAKFDPAMRNKSGLLLSDDIVGTGLAAAAPRFYSHVENIAKAAPEKMTANEWKAYLKNKGATKEELEALRVHDLLGEDVERSGASAAQGTPAQDALNEWRKTNKGKPPDDLLKASRAEVEARVKAGTVKDESPVINREDLINHLNENKVELNEKWLGGDDKRKNGEQFNDYLNSVPNSKPRFAQYQLPGGSNYRELLLSTKDNPKKLERINEINKELDPTSINGINEKIRQVTSNGGSNAVELLKQLKERKYDLAAERLDLEQAFTHEHWPGQKDVVVHSRMNDRFIPEESGSGLSGDNKNYGILPDINGKYEVYQKDNGKGLEGVRKKFNTKAEAQDFINQQNKKGYNTLHAEEVQSDWLQQGNSEGFKLSAKDKAKLEPEFNRIEEKIVNSGDEQVMSNPEIKDAVKLAVDKKIITEAEAKTYLRYSESERLGAVKDAPFKSTWSDLMIKRLIRQASEEGKDAISWTPGQTQVDRYPQLQQHYDRLEYNPITHEFKAYNKEGQLAKSETLDKSDLVRHIGKEVTDKLINNPSKKIKDSHNAKEFGNTHILENADLKVGGEFHKKFYDEIMVNKVNAIAKKYGARVEEKALTQGDFKEIRNKIANKEHGMDYEMLSQRDQRTVAEKAFGMNNKVWFLKLTPELKKAALEKGFSMFETGLPLTPVPGNPFENKNKFKLIPISGDPFK